MNHPENQSCSCRRYPMPEYWMRSIDFAKAANLLRLIINSPDKWSASELNRAGIDSGIFKTSEGKPFGPTSCYRYRRILEKLDLVKKRNRRFIANLNPAECEQMLTPNDRENLSEEQRVVLGNRVVCNPDCYQTFWRAFMPSKKPNSLNEFIDDSNPITMSPMIGPKKARKRSYVTIKRWAHADIPMEHRGYNAIQAIHFGMRNWGVNQLGFLDEFYQVGQGYHIIPVRPNQHENTETIERAIIESLEFRDNWAMSSISELLLRVCAKLKIPTVAVRSVLRNWIGTYPNFVAPVTVSNRMILSAQPEKVIHPILKGFLRLSTGEHVSHLQIHNNLKSRLIPTFQKEASIGS